MKSTAPPIVHIRPTAALLGLPPVLAFALLAFAAPAHAQESDLTFEGAYVADFLTNASGGVRAGSALLHNLDLTLGWDGSRALGIEGIDAFVYVLGNTGDSMVERVGDAQVASNIEAPEALRLYELWIRKRWEDQGSLLVGLYDLNSEFYVTDAAGLFLNSSHGVGPELASSGVTGPSIFPVTSLTARLEWTPSSGRFIRAAVLDAIPGHPSDDSSFVHIDLGGGALLIAEAGLVNEAARRKLALGAWSYTSDFPDAVDDSRTHGPTHGVYLLAETGLGTLGGPERQVVGFGRIGYADPNVHPVTLGWAAGLVYDRPWGVEDAQVGFGVASAVLSSRYLEAREADASPVDRAEVAFEVTGSVPVTGRLRVQPNLQYVVNPGMDPTLDNSLVLGVRIEFGF